MFKLLSDLKAAWLTNILLSDTYLPIKKILEQKWMYSWFDYLYLSCEIWFSKYDDVINSTCFSIANIVSDHNLSTNKVIFIDDRIENCLIANRLWVRYIHLQDPVKTIALIKNFLNI
jgi:FMN phosphatase YigB (HAD superfamily)